MRASLLAALLAFAVYNANFRTIATGDSFPARFLPFAILQGTLRLDPVLEATRMGHPNAYWVLLDRSGRFVSMYPIVTPLLAAPLYIPAFVVWTVHGRSDPALRLLGEWMEKLAASAIAAAAVAFFHFLVRARLEPSRTRLLTIAFAFGTNTWATSSQALWQHGAGELLLSAALVALSLGPSLPTALAVGILGGLATMNRPPDALLAFGLLAFVGLAWRLRYAAAAGLAACIAAAPFLAYNWTAFHDLAGGYGVAVGTLHGGRGMFFRASPVTTGIAGLLVSPGKGLLVYCPFLLFLAALPWTRLETRDDARLAACLALAIAAQVVLYARTDWRAGASYGPRFLTDALPFLLYLLAPVLRSLSRRGLIAFAGLVGVAAGLQVIGAFFYPNGGSDFGRDPWKLRDAPFLVEASAGRAPMHLLESLRPARTAGSGG